MFDTGSHRSFITQAAARRAKLPVVKREWLTINAFGERNNRSELRDIVQLCVSPVSGGTSVKLEAFVMKEISNIPNCHVEMARDRYSHLNGLWFSDVNLHKDR